MARWKPENKIGPAEQIGRRLFDEPKLSGAPDQNAFHGLSLSNFMETRDDAEFSLDRLGRCDCEPPVLRYLNPRAEVLAKAKRAKAFNGWAPLSVKELLVGKHKFSVVASAIQAKDAHGADLPYADHQMDENRYHAHIEIPQMPGVDKQENAEIFAHRFREKVRRVCLPNGQIIQALPTQGPLQSDGLDSKTPSALARLIGWCQARFSVRK